MKTLKPYSKAIGGSIAASVTALLTAVVNPDILSPEMITAIGILLTGFLTYGSPKNVED